MCVGGGGDGTWPRELLPAKAPEHEAVGDTTSVFKKQNEVGLHSDGLIFFSLVWTPLARDGLTHVQGSSFLLS